MSTSRTLVQPDIAELVVRLFGLEAYGEVAGLIRRGANQYAVVIDLVAEDLFLDSQRHICHLGLEAQFRIGIQSVEFHIAIGKEDLLRWQLFSYLSPAQSGSFSPASHRTCAFQRIRRSIHTDSRTGCCPTDSQAISCLLGECVSSMCSSRIVLPWFLCSLRLRLDFQL